MGLGDVKKSMQGKNCSKPKIHNNNNNNSNNSNNNNSNNINNKYFINVSNFLAYTQCKLIEDT